MLRSVQTSCRAVRVQRGQKANAKPTDKVATLINLIAHLSIRRRCPQTSLATSLLWCTSSTNLSMTTDISFDGPSFTSSLASRGSRIGAGS